MSLRFVGFFLFVLGTVCGAQAQEATCGTLTDNMRVLLAYDECRDSADCAALQLPPPFGCNKYVNRAYVKQINALLPEYERACGPYSYQCLHPADHLHCRKGRCEGKVYLDSLPDNAARNRHGRPLR